MKNNFCLLERPFKIQKNGINFFFLKYLFSKQKLLFMSYTL